jgi:protein tyrosine phosphatase (PTP) superfamily phosphohydrolase (DUF442 family)
MQTTQSSRRSNAAMLLAAILASGIFSPAIPVRAETFTTASISTPAAAIEAAPSLVPNFEKVSRGIWRGGVPSDKALKALAHDGAKTIVDLRMDGSGVDKEGDCVKQLGMKYYHFPLGFNAPEPDKLRGILAIMTNPANQPVFVHCRQGADRTGMLIGIYRMVWQGWTFPETWDEMRKHGFKPFLLTMKRQVENARSDEMRIAAVVPTAGYSEPATALSALTEPIRSAVLPNIPASDKPLLVAKPLQDPQTQR